jgi:hypothetical protein
MYSGTYLVLGGAGLVGMQVCRQVAQEFSPARIVVASLKREEAELAARELSRQSPRTLFEPAWGDLFVPTELAELRRGDLLGEASHRQALRDALYGDFREAYGRNHLVRLIQRFRPEVVIDSVNTATGISYQDVFDGASRLIDDLDQNAEPSQLRSDLELFLLSQSVPQVIRHVRLLYEAMREVSTKAYIKIGTTGTGGMGLNIPYTHSEDKPSQKLLAKTEVAFGHTGLLFLMARTPDAPIVKEIKPAAMIGYKAVEHMPIRRANGQPVRVFEPRSFSVEPGCALVQNDAPESYVAKGELATTVVNTGENGIFTLGEFATITALGQMEFVTPEEIARNVVLEIKGVNPGVDVLSALDSTVMGPSYRAGLLRQVAISDLKRLEQQKGDHSVALGQLGPPELSKLLFEADLLRRIYPQLLDAEALVESPEPAEVAQRMAALALESPIARTAISVGIPILMPDGITLLRGPRINIPELRGHATSAPIRTASDVDAWARKGWIDLRPSNMATWLDRFRRMRKARASVYSQGSAAVGVETYLGDAIEIGDVVAWIFNNEMGGFRLK